ncbi:MAG: GFA family protein [Paraglaciecola sp.]|uniref:GFA family protein n=1 Tax=Pseudomonadati TaxID=3379134 RepID=UPI00273F291E|nr:GFA family protein [Paraglaciecola sp.]MDP5031134.1 GFA family protein [Paraglaciecola sp.]MDP5132137.1 GFA family protein [Paraglaciecola sp.]
MSNTLAGSCLCGTVTFSLKNEFKCFYLCHCRQCQKITGSAHVAHLFTQPDNIQWFSGEENITRYDDPKRSFSKVFCAQCGCGLPFVNKSGNALIVPAGVLDDQPTITPSHNIFWAERAAWYDAALLAKHCVGFPE